MMADGAFTSTLFIALQRSYTERQELLQMCEMLTQERLIIRRRVQLLQELLILEGEPCELPDIF